MRDPRPAPKLKDVTAALDAAWGDARSAEEEAEENPEPTRDPAVLRKALLEDAAENGEPDGNERRDGFYSGGSSDLVTALVKLEGRAGVEWVEANLPAVYYLTAMNVWAGLDPDAAFDHVAASRRRPPCSPTLVVNLLDHKARTGPEALREAAAKIPWENLYAGDAWENKPVMIPDRLDLSETVDFRNWRDSGVLRTLAEEGVRFDGIFRSWGKLDADEAVREWATWPNLSTDDANAELRAILLGGEDWSAEAVTRLAGVLKNAGPDAHDRIVEWMRGPGQDDLEDQAEDFRKLLQQEGGQ